MLYNKVIKYILKQHLEIYGESLLNNILPNSYKNIIPVKIGDDTETIPEKGTPENIGTTETILIFEEQLEDHLESLFKGIPIFVMSNTLKDILNKDLTDHLLLETKNNYETYKDYKQNENIIMIEDSNILYVEKDEFYECLASTSEKMKKRIFNGEVQEPKKYFKKRISGKYFHLHKDLRFF